MGEAEAAAMSSAPALSPATALTVRQAASRVVARQVRDLLRHERGARRGADDAEAIHQMRVQTRRLRAALALFSGVVRPPRRAGRSRLRWLARTLGRVRDLDVIGALLEDDHLPHLVGVEAARLEDLVAALKERRWRAKRKLKAGLARRRYAKLKAALLEVARRPRFRKTEKAEAMAARFLADRIHRDARRVSGHRGMTERSPSAADLHKLRIAVKRLRYVLDFHAETCGLAFDEERTLTRELQDCLGEIHDHDLLLSWFAGESEAATPVEAALFAGAWRALPERLAVERGTLFRKFLRLRRKWLARTEPARTVAPLEEPRFVSLEAAPVQLRLTSPQKTVASLRIVR
jgi:CHAD domain-containing protein